MASLDPTHIPISFGAKDPSKSRGQAVQRTPATERLHLPAIPDLRLEQSYLRSVAPYVHWRHVSRSETQPNGTGLEKTRSEKGKERAQLVEDASATATLVEAGSDVQAVEVTSIEWGRVLWITVRDQVVSPLVQGTLFGVASFYFRPLLTALFTSSLSNSSPRRPPPGEGGGASWLRTKLRSFMMGGVETNIALKGHHIR